MNNNESKTLCWLWSVSDKYPKDTFRFWITHVFYNLAKDVYYLLKVKRW